MVRNQRHATQRDTLAGKRGLHNLVRVVEVQPAFGFQIRQFLRNEPTLPRQLLVVFEAVVVVSFNQ